MTVLLASPAIEPGAAAACALSRASPASPRGLTASHTTARRSTFASLLVLPLVPPLPWPPATVRPSPLRPLLASPFLTCPPTDLPSLSPILSGHPVSPSLVLTFSVSRRLTSLPHSSSSQAINTSSPLSSQPIFPLPLMASLSDPCRPRSSPLLALLRLPAPAMVCHLPMAPPGTPMRSVVATAARKSGEGTSPTSTLGGSDSPGPSLDGPLLTAPEDEASVAGAPRLDEGTSGEARRRFVVPLPFVRKLRMHMDSCPGTNKSQFFFGGLGLMLSVGLLDCAMVVFMVVGHTKFGPDLVARQIAGSYNQADAFNHGQLVRLMTPYSTAGFYGDEVLHTWKAGTEKLFSSINHIMSYRGFLLLADDGKVELGSPETPDVNKFEPFEDTGPLYKDAKLMLECDRAACRSLKEDVFPSLRKKKYHGVDRAAVTDKCQDSKGALLLPDSVLECRKVRLFTRRHADDRYWREQMNWMKDASVNAVNVALASV